MTLEITIVKAVRNQDTRFEAREEDVNAMFSKEMLARRSYYKKIGRADLAERFYEEDLDEKKQKTSDTDSKNQTAQAVKKEGFINKLIRRITDY